MHAYSHSGDRLRALGLLTVISILVAILLNRAADTIGLGPNWLFGAPTVAAVFGLFYGALDRWAWRWHLLRATGVITTPDIHGSYAGRLRSSYGSTELEVALEIEQTWTRLIVRFRVVERQSSESISLAAALTDVGAKHARLTYVYRNTVRPGFADPDMNDHDGTAELTMDATSGEASGRYYNYRGRQGTLQFMKQ